MAATWADAVAGWQSFREEVLSGKEARREPRTLRAYIADRWPAMSARVAKKTAQSEKYFLDARVLPALGSYRLNALKVGVLRDFAKALRAEGLSGATVNACLAIVSKFVRDAHEHGEIERILFTKMPHEAVPPVHDELSPSERIALLDACGAKLRPVIVLALETGLRRGDLLRLTGENVDGETLRLTVGKTRTPLVLPLSSEARQAFKDLKKLHPKSERLVPLSVTTLRRLFVAAKRRTPG